MKAADFRKIALSLEGVEEYSHAGFPAFRVGGRKFASLATQGRRIWKSDAYARATDGVCRGGTEDFSADSWRLGKGGPHAYTLSRSERGRTDGRTPDGVETARSHERKDARKETGPRQNAEEEVDDVGSCQPAFRHLPASQE
jgi:hypothetical protein